MLPCEDILLFLQINFLIRKYTFTHKQQQLSRISSLSLQQMSRQSFKVCFCFRRIFKLRVLEPPEDVKILFDQYSQNGTMSLDNLRGFLVEFQGEYNATRDDAQAIFNSLKHLNIFSRRGLHLEAFFRYLLGDLNGPLSPSRVVILFSFF